MSVQQYANQVAGKTPIMVIFTGHLLKPTCAIEYNHYKTISETNPKLLAILPFCCYVVHNGNATPIRAEECQQCSGEDPRKIEKKLNDVAPFGYHIILHDYAHNMVSPRIADLKLGRRTWGDDKTEEKKRTMAANDAASTSATLGIRLSGGTMTVEGILEKLDKENRGIFTDAQLIEYLKKFFTLPNQQVVSAHRQILEIQKIINQSKDWSFIGASILLIVDETPKTDIASTVVVKLIDMAHSTIRTSEEPDESALFGLESLRAVLEEILKNME